MIIVSKKFIMSKKRVYNPKTGKYYAVRQKNTSKGKKGQIMGLWKNPKSSKPSSDKWIKDNFGDVLRALSNE